MNLTGLYVQKRIIIYWHTFHSSGFHHICNLKCRLDCRYSPQNIFNAKNFNTHKKPISLLNVPICTHGMQRTWWPEAGTIIVTGPHSLLASHRIYERSPHNNLNAKTKWQKGVTQGAVSCHLVSLRKYASFVFICLKRKLKFFKSICYQNS